MVSDETAFAEQAPVPFTVAVLEIDPAVTSLSTVWYVAVHVSETPAFGALLGQLMAPNRLSVSVMSRLAPPVFLTA
jgi:hypothetical protein